MEQSKRVGIWIRVSTDMQVDAESPEHHERRARYYTEAKGWQVLEVYRLEAVSGKSVMGHPEAKRMLADIRSGHITGLVFSKLARLARSTKELLEFADIFRTEQADLISLSENIDTSSPAGRLFFTIISAMAEWEREEIASRVQASVPIRAKMGKSLGGQASFGYSWVNNQLVLNEAEAPIRKLLYELFLTHQRKASTATALNDLGYRTRNGSQFSDTTVHRLLRDSTAKGERRANYTKSSGKDKQWMIKPQSEWVMMPCPPVVSAELWEKCNSILDTQEQKNVRVSVKAVYLLSGFVQCECGKTMYVRHKSKMYLCGVCKVRISTADIDEIYQVYLKDYLGSINHEEFVAQSDSQLHEKKQLLETTRKERTKLSKRMNDLLTLRLDNELSKERFTEQHKPMEERLAQLDEQLPDLEAEIDVRTMQLLSSDAILTEVQQLHYNWADMTFEQKRAIVETITTSIVIGTEDITINLAYAPSISGNGKNVPHTNRDSYSPPA
ncbi:recombinase family protein [Mucilaginibacter sp.]|uniref:recombinase family protein n=1 Tax=Mucilaginibacter sp. TaxID=1882438 RepID=UPI00263269DA|nr:recombinase family protein [Mucilaginibacter sp.]MDB4921203.1 recombinase family protein [Mucilaginibacter sp.]